MSATLNMLNAEQRFNSAFNALLAQSKKSTDELWTQQVSGIVRNLFAVTPPMGGKDASVKMPAPGKKARGIVINFGEGKARGKSTIESDIAFAFRKSKKSDENALNQYLARRTKQKRFRRFGEKINATAQDVAAVKKNILARQGTTASGWNSAVSKLGISVPKWISGHSKVPSKFSINNSRTGFYDFEAVNGTNHTDSARIERRIAIAINMQANSIERWLRVYNERLGNDLLK
jgi:hypothetical protein